MKLYSIGCPNCNVLEKKLEKAGFEFELISNEEEVKKTGFTFFPVLEVDNQLLDFTSAIAWLKEKSK